MQNFFEKISTSASETFNNLTLTSPTNTSPNAKRRSLQQFDPEPVDQIDEPEHAVSPGTLSVGDQFSFEGYNVEIKRFLAEGGKAHVYLVEAVKKGEVGNKDFEAVLKRVPAFEQGELDTINDEVKFMKSLKGKPNIVEFYDSLTRRIPDGEQGLEVLILMEYCPDGTLVELMQSRNQSKFNEKEIWFMFHDICMGVASMHYHDPPIVHRDLKVENVLISSKKRFTLADFGSATIQIIHPNTKLPIGQANRLEEELGQCTTLAYRAPEMVDLFAGRGLGEPMDLWALGVLLYKLCYFTTPFEDQGSLAILNCRYTFPATPSYSQDMIRLIDSLLQESPSDRPTIYQLVKEVANIRQVPCQLQEKENPVYIAPVAANLTPVVMTPEAPRSAPVKVVNEFEFQTENITPMRRGRPTRSKPETNTNSPMQPVIPVLSTPKLTPKTQSKPDPFGSVGDDPFQMLAMGLDLPASHSPIKPTHPAFPDKPDLPDRGRRHAPKLPSVDFTLKVAPRPPSREGSPTPLSTISSGSFWSVQPPPQSQNQPIFSQPSFQSPSQTQSKSINPTPLDFSSRQGDHLSQPLIPIRSNDPKPKPVRNHRAYLQYIEPSDQHRSAISEVSHQGSTSLLGGISSDDDMGSDSGDDEFNDTYQQLDKEIFSGSNSCQSVVGNDSETRPSIPPKPKGLSGPPPIPPKPKGLKLKSPTTPAPPTKPPRSYKA